MGVKRKRKTTGVKGGDEEATGTGDRAREQAAHGRRLGSARDVTVHDPQTGTSREQPCLRVLVPVDGSAGAGRAVAHAIDLVRCARSIEVHIANVQPALTYVETLVAAPRVLADYWSNVAGHEAVRPACSLLESAGVAHEVHLERGELPEAIEAIARRLGCDLIVMGTRGMGAVGSLALGSVATGVVRCADRPVTLVKGKPAHTR